MEITYVASSDAHFLLQTNSMSRMTPHHANQASQPRSAEILRVLSQEMASGKLVPGTQLKEEVLCERFDASRTPVRDALKQLAAQGLVELRPRQGAFVVQLTLDRLAAMFETMGYLEAACAALAARRHTAEDLQDLSNAHQACMQAATEQDAESSHNPHIENLTIELRNRVEAYRREVTFHPGLMNLSIREHDAVLGAIRAMDESSASVCMRQHLDTLRTDAVSMAASLARRYQ
ncbi:MAG: GntR family transcriptional regulator [Burkholderiales bacterium]|nr:GntR family transcriptional regulator [Burkholderiales bacterium]